MTETLYPHEQIIKVLNIPNTISESIEWLMFAWAILIIQMFIIYAFVKINEYAVSWNIVYGLNICCYLTSILVGIGLLGLAQSLNRSNQ